MDSDSQKRAMAADLMADDPPRRGQGATRQADGDSGDPGDRTDAEAAGYMELEGAEKDADCRKVEVPDGISSELGFCNLFKPNPGADAFKCGNCEYVTAE